MSSVPRHSEEELRQQWAFLDALVDRQAASLKSGSQDPEEDDLTAPMVAPDSSYLEEISTLTQRVTTLEDERSSLLRRIDLAEEARMAAESGRAAAEAARRIAEQELAEARSRPQVVDRPTLPPEPVRPHTASPASVPLEPAVREPIAREPVVTRPAVPAAPAPPVAVSTPQSPSAAPPTGITPKQRRKSWWQRIRE